MESKFINSKSNDSFINFKGLELQELLLEIDKYLLEYRELINIPNYVTFGTEIEYECVPRNKVSEFLDSKFYDWISVGDGSLTSGGEIISPIMTDDKEFWFELKEICDFLTEHNADTSKNAGGHIHVGAHVLGNDVETWKNFIKLYIAYENIIFRFIYGDKISARYKLTKYAPPIADELYSSLGIINESLDLMILKKYLPIDDKYHAVNFGYVKFNNIGTRQEKNTLEFRSPNASSNAIVWQNNINLFTKMLLSSKDKVMDMDFIDYKLSNEFKCFYDNKFLYNEVNLKKALEFVDLIFDNNLDKIYFLKQYLKHFENNYGLTKAVKAKRFTR